jgi:hypothetical protein
VCVCVCVQRQTLKIWMITILKCFKITEEYKVSIWVGCTAAPIYALASLWEVFPPRPSGLELGNVLSGPCVALLSKTCESHHQVLPLLLPGRQPCPVPTFPSAWALARRRHVEQDLQVYSCQCIMRARNKSLTFYLALGNQGSFVTTAECGKGGLSK